jgi:MbtH protein
MRDEEEIVSQDSARYRVVRNDEEQYSIWPEGRDDAPGWHDAGFSGSKEECLRRIEELWTDMRPLSLRLRMEQSGS